MSISGFIFIRESRKAKNIRENTDAVIEAGTARLYINGGLVLEQPANPGIYNVKGIEFGAGSSAATGQACFDEIRAFAISEPATLLLLGFGGLALIRKHRA